MSVQDKAEQSMRIVREAKEVTYDTETSGLDWKRNFPVGYVIGSGNSDVVYVPTRHGGGGNLPDPMGCKVPDEADGEWNIHSYEKDLAAAFKYRIDNNVGKTIGHHIKFDCHFSANADILLGRNLSCTQNNAALLDEYSKGFSLEAQAKKHGVTAKLGQEMYDHLGQLFDIPATKTSMSHFWRTAGNDQMTVDYAEGDGVTTIELYHKQVSLLHEQNLTTVWNLENELIWTLYRMERRGVAVSEKYLKELLAEIEGQVAKAYEVLPPDFNVRSPIQVKAYVEQFATDWPTTEKGNPSFKEDWLKTFDEGMNIIKVRKWTNLANTFARPLLEEHSFKGRVHATLNQLKADDGGTIARLSCSHPNLTAVPKHDKELAPKFRRAFRADEGMILYEADWSQCEPRLFAHYSNEPRLVEGYNADPPVDVHTIVAEMFNADRNTKAKRMNMGMFTGMFPKSFAGHMGVSVSDATDLWNKWFNVFPKIRPFQNRAKNNILANGFVFTLLGRRGRLEANRWAYKATSKIIQGGNADIIKYKLVEIDKYLESMGDESFLFMSVHDSILWQSPKDDDKTPKIIEAMMVDVQGEPFNLRVPFTVDLDGGDNWAEASFGADYV